ncbi:MAG: Gfo/Idh/MocA family oxidoreductase [Anaerolineae bacterium]|nr:Gfo/Idh/MocA family oxidoreductase [Anaerolineae bacterium]
MKKLNWGILGTARISQKLISAMKLSKRSQFYGIASRSSQNAEAFARQWNIPKSYSSYEALLADPTVDVVYIPLPNHLHAEWTIKSLEAGKHVLCEKPLALSVIEVQNIINASRQHRCFASEAFMYRHLKQTTQIKQMIDNGEIGNVTYARGSFSFMLDRPEDIRLVSLYGGGCLWDVGCYPVSYARVMIGQTPAEVEGFQQVGPSGVDEFFIGQMAFPCGALAQFDCSFRLPSYTCFEIRGDQGTIHIPLPFNPSSTSNVTLHKQGKTKNFSFRAPHLYLGEIEDMNSAVLGEKPPLISLEDSLENVKTLNALYQSARQRQPVRLIAAP